MKLKFLLSAVFLAFLCILPLKAQNVTSVSGSGTEAIRLISDDRVTVLKSGTTAEEIVISNPTSRRKKYFSCPDEIPNLCGPVEAAPKIEQTSKPIDTKIEIKEPEKKPFFLPDPVFFRINKSVIDASEWSKVEKAVSYLNANPSSTVVVTGYADKKTGTAAINLRLSEQRSNAVAKALETKYGIAKGRISVNWRGDGIQPFELENDKNRAVLFLINP